MTKLDPRSGAALKPIGVGNGPAAIAVGYGGVWVANRDDGTVTRIDAATDAVSDTVRVGGSPVAVAAGLGAIWVADAGKDAVIRIDPRTRRVSRRIALGSAPSALAVAGGSVWAAATASRAGHRGGTLRFALRRRSTAAASTRRATTPDHWPVLSLAYDGLVAYRRIPGAGGSTLVADLAASVPQPSDGGRTYTFQLRPGLRFSDGTPVRPEDFRASIERVVRLAGQGAAVLRRHRRRPRRARPRRCDLVAGHRDRRRGADDHHPPPPARRRVPAQARHPAGLRAPRARAGDADPPAARRRAPARTRSRRSRRGAACGWCATRASAPGRPRRAPTASPTRSTSRPSPTRRGAGRRRAARPRRRRRRRRRARAASCRSTQGRALALADAEPRHHGARADHDYALPQRPRAAVRRPAGPPGAELRDRSPARGRARGGSGLAGLSCQLHPARAARLRARRARTPATRRRAAAGRRRISPAPAGWSRRPARAERGCGCGASEVRGRRPLRRRVLRRLGYRVRVRMLPDRRRYFDYINDSRHHAQVGFTAWVDDFLTPSSFFEPFSCTHLVPGSGQRELSQFCDPAVDAALRRRPGRPRRRMRTRAGPPSTAGCWRHRRRSRCSAAARLLLVSDRVGNAQMHQLLGPLLDQFWVR